MTTATTLITGATGANGTELVKLFAAQNIPVRALVRAKNRAQSIALAGVDVVEGDFDHPETLSAALKGIERAFLLVPSSEDGQKQQLAFVEAAKTSGVKHIVKLSQLGASRDSSQRFLHVHGVVEDAIRASGLAFTFLRPNLFMQGLLSFKTTINSQNAFYAPADEGKISIVDVRDIAQVAFASLTQAGHEGKILRHHRPAIAHARGNGRPAFDSLRTPNHLWKHCARSHARSVGRHRFSALASRWFAGRIRRMEPKRSGICYSRHQGGDWPRAAHFRAIRP